jgi:integrase/recombinase XerC
MLNRFIALFLEYIERERNFSLHTRVSYAKDLQQFESFLQREFHAAVQHPKQIDQGAVRSFLALLLDSGMSKKSVVRKMSTLRSFFKFAVRKKLISVNPMSNVVTPKVERRLPQFLDERAVEELMALPDHGDPIGVRDAAVLELLYSTGMRRGELIGLEEADFNFYEKTVKVIGKGNKERIIPFGEHAHRALKDYMVVRRELVKTKTQPETDAFFLTPKGKALYPGGINAIVKKYFSKISEIRQQSPHVLRHSFATHMLDRGADIFAVKELLGHESLSTTQVYTHVTSERLKKVYQQAHPKAS